MMDNEKLNTALYEKMFAEQEKFRDWLLTQPPEEILNHTYTYTIREDVLMSLEYNELTDAQASALLASESPLEDIFHRFDKRETDHMDNIFDCITSRADEEVRRQREALLHTPVYKHPGAYAREHDELPVYRASNKANAACKEAIEAAISTHYSDNILHPGGVSDVVDRFGYDRTFFVLANTVRQQDWDGRYSNDNKAWAKSIDIEANPDTWGNDRNSQFVVNSHPGLVDLFVKQARREYTQEKEPERPRESVLKKLKEAQALTAASPAKKAKDMEL